MARRATHAISRNHRGPRHLESRAATCSTSVPVKVLPRLRQTATSVSSARGRLPDRAGESARTSSRSGRSPSPSERYRRHFLGTPQT